MYCLWNEVHLPILKQLYITQEKYTLVMNETREQEQGLCFLYCEGIH